MPRCRCSHKSLIVVMATKENLPTKQSRSANTPTGEESKIPAQQPSGLGELATSMAAEVEKRLEVVQRTQISSRSEAEKTKEPQDRTPKRQSPSPATRPRRYVLELWVEIEICSGMYAAIDTLNRAYPGCTGVYLGEASHMVAFYGKKANSKAGLIHDEAVVASKVILEIPTWMGHFARWRVKCVSICEVSKIVAGCKRLEKENLRRARLELQKRFSGMQVDSTLSATARPFQPQVTPHSSNLMKMKSNLLTLQGADGQEVVLPWALCPVHQWEGRLFTTHSHQKMRVHLMMPAVMTGLLVRGVEVEGVRKAGEAATLMIHAPWEGGERRRMDFLVKSRFLNSVVRRDILMMWLTPLGSGPGVSLITAITMRIHTSCLW